MTKRNLEQVLFIKYCVKRSSKIGRGDKARSCFTNMLILLLKPNGFDGFLIFMGLSEPLLSLILCLTNVKNLHKAFI